MTGEKINSTLDPLPVGGEATGATHLQPGGLTGEEEGEEGEEGEESGALKTGLCWLVFLTVDIPRRRCVDDHTSATTPTPTATPTLTLTLALTLTTPGGLPLRRHFNDSLQRRG